MKERYELAFVTSCMLFWEMCGSEAGGRSFKALKLFYHSEDKVRTTIIYRSCKGEERLVGCFTEEF